MAKSFYTAQEAAERLGKTEDDLKDLVRAGALREFRDGANVTYKVDDVEALVTEDSSASDTGTGSASGEVVLEPVEDSGIELTPSGSDILSLEELDPGDTSSSTAAGKTDVGTRKKGDTVVPSVGVNVFDDDELDEVVDPLAQTAVTDVGGLGIDGVGSGSGILDLTKESDDTSLGAELLEEIYSGEEEDSGVGVGEDTRAGLEEAITEEEEEEPVVEAEMEPMEPSAEPAAAEPEPVTQREPVGAAVAVGGPDALSTGLTALLVVAVVVMWFAGLAGAALVRGSLPSVLNAVYERLALFAGGTLGVAIIAGAVTFLVVRRSK
jgi:hypothetical protein